LVTSSTRTGRSTGAVVMTDVARAAGVSQKTVSRVVNGSHQVRPEVRDRVLQAIDELGYRRNGAARALAAGRTHVIGIVAMGSPLFGIAQHVIGIERAARERGYGTVVVTLDEDEASACSGQSHGAAHPAEPGEDQLRPALERALALGAEGLVVVEPFARGASTIAGFADVPMVSPRHSLVGDARSPLHCNVTAAEHEAARTATEHLLDLGHRHVAHLAGPRAWQPALHREQGWREALAERGAPVPEPVRGDWSARSGYDAARRLLARGDTFTALFAGNDAMAIGAMRALGEAELRVPQDVAVIGFDDLPESEFLVVPLSSMRQDFTAIARLSVERLVDALEGRPAQERSVVVPARLVVRESSGGPRRGGGDPA
jgi:DNA-binding LacI/PurR family transcriptional regulator